MSTSQHPFFKSKLFKPDLSPLTHVTRQEKGGRRSCRSGGEGSGKTDGCILAMSLVYAHMCTPFSNQLVFYGSLRSPSHPLLSNTRKCFGSPGLNSSLEKRHLNGARSGTLVCHPPKHLAHSHFNRSCWPTTERRHLPHGRCVGATIWRQARCISIH